MDFVCIRVFAHSLFTLIITTRLHPVSLHPSHPDSEHTEPRTAPWFVGGASELRKYSCMGFSDFKNTILYIGLGGCGGRGCRMVFEGGGWSSCMK